MPTDSEGQRCQQIRVSLWLTFLHEQHYLFRHEDVRQAKKDILLGDSWQGASVESGDVVLDAKVGEV